jgi:hypothetical protein
MSKQHGSRPVMVRTDVDLGIADEVEFLNRFQEIRTFASCQGSPSYRPYVMAWWPPEHNAMIREMYDLGEDGDGWTYLHPKITREPAEPKVRDAPEAQ